MKLNGFAAVASVLVAATALAGCGGAGSSGGDNSIDVGYLHSEVVDVAVWAGLENGTFAKQGLKIKMVPFDDGPSLNQALVSGHIDLGVSGAAMMTSLAGKGQAKDVGALWIEDSTEQIIALANTGIQSIKDLKGKSIAVPFGTSAQIILHSALTANGMNEKDVRLVNSSVSGAASAAISGAVPAAAVWVPHAFRILQKHPDAKVLATGAKFFPEVGVVGGVAANNRYYSQNRDQVVKFVAAAVQGADAAVNDKGVLDAVWKKRYSDLEPLDAFTANWKSSLYPSATQWAKYLQDGSLAKWLRGTEQSLVDIGGLDSVRDPKEFFDDKLFTEALKLAQTGPSRGE